MNRETADDAPTAEGTTRRGFARRAVGAAAAIATAGLATPRRAAADDRTDEEGTAASSNAPFRFCHMTDWHVCPERRSVEGAARALETAATLRPDLLVTGGDLIYDSFATTRSRADEQWMLFKELMAASPVPVEHCLGNHDLWGWHREKSGATGDEPDYGMRKALDELGLASSWRSFDRGGWHFVILDSVASDGGSGYLGRLSAPQREWLEADLAANALPTVVVSHIPILSITPIVWQRDYDRGNRGHIAGSEMHLDGRSLHRVFRENGRVRLCLSGHMHMIDRCEIDEVVYCNGGAVCGAWWKKDPEYCDPCFAEVDLRPDGTFTHRMRPTGWTNV